MSLGKAEKSRSAVQSHTGTREHAQSFLTDDHIERIVKAYAWFKDEPGFTRITTLGDIRTQDGNLSVPLYVAPAIVQAETKVGSAGSSLEDSLSAWLESSCAVRESLGGLLTKGAVAEERAGGMNPKHKVDISLT